MALRLLLGYDWYTPEQESETNQYRLRLRRINGLEATELLNMSRTGSDTKEGSEPSDADVKNAVYKSLDMALDGWENMLDEQGEEVPFSKDMIKYLPLKTQVDAYREIIRLATLSEEQVKN